MKLETFLFWNGVILVAFFVSLLVIHLHEYRDYRDFQRQSKLNTLYYGK